MEEVLPGEENTRNTSTRKHVPDIDRESASISVYGKSSVRRFVRHAELCLRRSRSRRGNKTIGARGFAPIRFSATELRLLKSANVQLAARGEDDLSPPDAVQ